MHLAYIWIVSHLCAKNYRNWWKFEEVLTKTNLLSFFGTRCICRFSTEYLKFGRLMTTMGWHMACLAVVSTSINSNDIQPTSVRKMAVKNPKATASVASWSTHGMPMCEVSQISCFQSSTFHSADAMSNRTTLG